MSGSAPADLTTPGTSETLAAARARARQLGAGGDHFEALALTDRLLAAFPLCDDLRFDIADLLDRAGRADDAAQIFQTLARHFTQSGRPLKALVAARVLTALGRATDTTITEIAETYGAGSGRLASFAARPAPFDQHTPAPPPEAAASEDPPPDLDTVAARARQRALDILPIAGHPIQLHPLPLLSELTPDSLAALLRGLVLHRLEDGNVVMREGESGSSFYFLAAGELQVSVHQSSGPTGADGGIGERQLARLHENSVFGEMALMTSQPRVASVRVLGQADVFEVSRQALDQLLAEIPSVQQALDRFARERLIRNLLATSALFTPFTADQQADLLRRFEGTEVDPGTEIIRQGEPGRGLYVVLSGELEVAARPEGAEQAVPLARLSTADIFGEMSLLTSQPTSATVRALSRCNLLFLPRVYVDRLAAAVPEVQAYFAGVASRRAADNSLRLGGAALPEVEIDIELDSAETSLLL